jgi:hypothetical protein
MKKLKGAIKEIAADLGMTIPNIEETRSRRSYNRYILEYDSVLKKSVDIVPSSVLLETSFAEVSFPTVKLPVTSLIGEYIAAKFPSQSTQYDLSPFEMKVQAIDRTLVDKVFALCDYYLQNRINIHSRHIYDIYKLQQIIPLDEHFRELVKEVREVRMLTNICPSAQNGVDVTELLNFIVDKEIYKEDYARITSHIIDENVPYEMAVQSVRFIADSGMFD